jgi:hypothetical protein
MTTCVQIQMEIVSKIKINTYFEKIVFVISDLDEVYDRLDFYMRGFYLLKNRNRSLIRRNNNLRREIRELQQTIEDHEDFIFGPIIAGIS